MTDHLFTTISISVKVNFNLQTNQWSKSNDYGKAS
jgi:hypothetical protein